MLKGPNVQAVASIKIHLNVSVNCFRWTDSVLSMIEFNHKRFDE